MKPVDMIVRHDPAAGTWGDCTRCCVASIFELPAEAVPHFTYRGTEPPEPDGMLPWEHRLRGWLAARGFSVVHFQLEGPDHVFRPGCLPFHYVRGGLTPRGTPHDTVWFDDRMVHDPHPSRAGLLPDAWPQGVMLFVKA